MTPLPEAPESTATPTVGAIAASRPASLAVFERLGIDYCCGGKRPFAEACAERGLDPAGVMEAIAAEEARTGESPSRDWTGATMTELADHIEQTHHAFVKDALGRLDGVVPRVVAAHGARHPELTDLAATYAQFAEEMRDHMIREERVLFPWLRRLEKSTEIHVGPPWSVKRPIDCMEHDHDEAGRALAKMRELTRGYAAPEGACPTYRSMLSTLDALERDTHIHIHKENNVLFPRGVETEKRIEAGRGIGARRNGCTCGSGCAHG